MHRSCNECGGPVTGPVRTKEFCSIPCRSTFNQRRARRGAQLYDIFMAMRFERDNAQSLGLWTIACRMAGHWRDEDKAERAKRHSWQNPQKLIEAHPYLRSE